MMPRRGSELNEEGMEDEVESMMAAGNMDVEVVHTMLTNLTPTTVADTMKVIREDRYKGKGAERDIAVIRVAVMVPDSAVVLITEGYGD